MFSLNISQLAKNAFSNTYNLVYKSYEFVNSKKVLISSLLTYGIISNIQKKNIPPAISTLLKFTKLSAGGVFTLSTFNVFKQIFYLKMQDSKEALDNLILQEEPNNINKILHNIKPEIKELITESIFDVWKQINIHSFPNIITYQSMNFHLNLAQVFLSYCLIFPKNYKEKIGNIIKYVTMFSNKVKSQACMLDIIKILTNNKCENNRILMNEMQFFFNDEMGNRGRNTFEIYNIFLTLKAIDPEKLPEFMENAKKLFLMCPEATKDLLSKERIITNLSKIKSDLKYIINNSQFLIDDKMSTYNVEQILGIMNHLPDHEIDEYIECSQTLCANINDVRDKIHLYSTIKNIPSNERKRRVNRANQQRLLDPLRNQTINRLRELLETPLHQPFAPIVQPEFRQNPNVINVHHGERDRDTKKALNLLKEQTKTYSTTQILEASKEFKKFLDKIQFLNPETKKNAQRALYLGDNGPWPPFMNNSISFQLDRESFTGEEIIGRMWLFSLTFDDQEKTNMQHGMITALNDSAEDGLVCDPGKAQRLVTAVLQGRLDGAKVDEVVFRPTTIFPYITDFFNVKENRNSNAEDLKIKAKQFCATIPKELQEKFLKEIEEFIRKTFN